MSEFKNATLFARIIEINNEMSRKLETRVDLQTENIKVEEVT